jgi:hypothetical protein
MVGAGGFEEVGLRTNLTFAHLLLLCLLICGCSVVFKVLAEIIPKPVETRSKFGAPQAYN